MIPQICVNELIKWNPDMEEEYVERILWVDSGAPFLYVIDVLSSEGLPKVRKLNEVSSALEDGLAIKMQEDPYIRIVNEEDIKASDREKRDKAWEIISSIVALENEPNIYQRDYRGPLIKRLVQEHDISYATLYKYLRRYWQRGKNKNSLLPDYYNSGGKGKRKNLGDKKIGRPRKNKDVIGPGVNVNEEIKKIFRLALNRDYYNPKENNLTTVYQLMIKNFFCEDYRFEDGIRKPVTIPIEQIPTFTQFRYWYEAELNLEKSLKARKGEKEFNLNHRAVLGKSDAEVIGPGSKYQIDATIADIYLVSRFNRNWIIGRPVIYAVIDCFSRMIAGLYIGLEGPSWVGSMMALTNAFTEKVSYCKEYGIDIADEDWPCFHVPQAILGDRGEMESRNADTLVNGLNIRIENTPSYRADWKGIVEQHFHIIHGHIKPLVPGYIDVDFHTRGGADYRLDAKLDIEQFTKIIIKCVLYHNNTHWMKKYEANEMMIEDDVDPIPRELWNWGIVNRSGKLKSYPQDIVKLNLMPVNSATVTEKGIKFKKMYYSCSKAIEENWFVKARNRSSWTVNFAYDPRSMNYIYIKSDDSKGFLKCSMIDTKKYANRTFDEIEYLLQHEKLKLDQNAGPILQSKIDLLSEIENVTKEAIKMTDEQFDHSLSNSERTKNIRENRRNEKKEERKSQAFELDKRPTVETDNKKVLPIRQEEVETYKYPSNIEYLRKKQQERMGKKDE